MSATDVAATITAIEHATWVVDHAYMPQRPTVDDNGVVTPVEKPGPPRLAVDVIEEKIRPEKRGRKREGLTVRLFMILLFVAARHGRVQIKDLLTLALDGLPVQMQRDLGIQYWTSRGFAVADVMISTVSELRSGRESGAIRPLTFAPAVCSPTSVCTANAKSSGVAPLGN